MTATAGLAPLVALLLLVVVVVVVVLDQAHQGVRPDEAAARYGIFVLGSTRRSITSPSNALQPFVVATTHPNPLPLPLPL